jgi:mRNA interferase MazF
MLNTLWAVVRGEKIEFLEKANIPEGTKVLVTILPVDNESHFWLKTSQVLLDTVWNNTEDDVILVRYHFTDLSSMKVRPAVVVSLPHTSEDIFIVPLTSKTTSLFPDEFMLVDWREAGLNVVTSVKRGIYTVNKNLVIKKVGKISTSDSKKLESSLRKWLGF